MNLHIAVTDNTWYSYRNSIAVIEKRITMIFDEVNFWQPKFVK